MSSQIRFILALHNHQPVGNFDGVIEQSYQDSYLPFLDIFEQYESLRIALHTSGCLMEWLDANHPEYVDRLAGLVASGRIEIVGGPFYEPILTMIPSRDRIGQIRAYSDWLEQRLGAKVRGMWMPERVWEQSLAADLASAGMQYTMLDDFHFKNAGLEPDALHGYYVTEDDGRILSIFPGSEVMRYLIPFAAPQETIHTLGEIAARHPNSIVTFADDGEKFGSWPDTKQHVYDDGWLRRFFDLLQQNQDWIKLTTPSEALEAVAPRDKIYLPEGSYREMTEWVLPAARQNQYEDLHHELEANGWWEKVAPYVRGGYWRNFKVKYPEANEMYSRMMQVSERLEQARRDGAEGEAFDNAQRELFRAQCNCSYWHGAFGGIYLPHLRNAVYNHLIAADNLLDQAQHQSESFVDVTSKDFNFDARREVCLANDKLIALAAPASGGMLYELDLRSICLNLLATLARRPEAYHRKVLAGASQHQGSAASIHDRVVFKQEGLDRRVVYDRHMRKSMIDHFYANDVNPANVASGKAQELGDFVTGAYEAVVRSKADRIQLQMIRTGTVDGQSIKITKGITLNAGESRVEIAYLIEGLPADRTFHFAPEFNFAALPAGAEDRYFYDADRTRHGHLGTQLDWATCTSIGMCDEWLGLDANFSFNQPTGLWTYPIESVSQSEGGFELVHQSLVVQPHWHINGQNNGAWSATMVLEFDTSMAENRRREAEAVAAN
ncbi:MAG: DUF1926 domain-containing protein [Planctomycetales bacterium]|nr:DUF1926 domain-containing protein [Planctomycetales bacterium]